MIGAREFVEMPKGVRMRSEYVRRAILLFVIISILQCAAFPQSQPVLLWPDGAPGSEGKPANETVRVNEDGEHIVSGVHRPSITPYLPSPGNATGAAVIVVPGGGHRELWMDHEGYAVAKWLSDRGVAAFVLKYRLARENGSTYTIEGTELGDLKRAIRMVRSRASEWGINKERIGAIGFSAGGELVSLASTRYDSGTPGATDPVERESSRPAFQALMYPGATHDESFSKDTPPAFLVCGEDDRPDISQGLAELYLALKRAGVSAELHIFARTGHGFGLRARNRPPVSEWPQLFVDWLDVQGFLKR
ncbi:MAG TPA: alpha/beta hydrolase [Terriglobales bacterium]|nr:alpha/beta hydrolase [Terriglobales bacterium]